MVEQNNFTICRLIVLWLPKMNIGFKTHIRRVLSQFVKTSIKAIHAKSTKVHSKKALVSMLQTKPKATVCSFKGTLWFNKLPFQHQTLYRNKKQRTSQSVIMWEQSGSCQIICWLDRSEPQQTNLDHTVTFGRFSPLLAIRAS